MTAPTYLADLEDDLDPQPAGFIAQPSAVDDEPEAPPRRQIGQRWAVDLDGGATLEVTTTNRDMIAWERTKARHKEWPTNTDAPIFATTFVVWSAARRAGLTPLTFDQFADAVLDLTKVSDEPADPTQ